ncbi:MAG: transglycosylase domain-containing protein [Desulfobulbaceae bacterium]|nr:transglycosylase domain-containing protein [Desulfobulbaceae bacterium]
MLRKSGVTLILICLFVAVGYETVAVIDARRKTPEIFAGILSSRSGLLHLSDLSPRQIKQLLLVEDPNFYPHQGFDFTTPGAGLTTITQAMVKYLYFDHFKPGFRKIEQTLIAWLAVNALVSKDEQLTVFINTAYLGTGEQGEVRGFPEAARVYFGKSFMELAEDEYLALVAMLIGPDEFNVKAQPEKNRARVQLIRKVLSGEYKSKGLRDVYYRQDN